MLGAIAAADYVMRRGDDAQAAGDASAYFYLSPTRPDGNQPIAASRFGNSDYCGHCHTEIFHEWNASAHHFSSLNNPYYRKVLLDTTARRGTQTMKFCAGCHDPLPLISGEIENADINRWSSTAGITCLACHRITEIHGANGGYVLSAPLLHPLALADHPPLQRLHGLMLRVTPQLHRAMLSKPFYSSPEYCATCHTLMVPKAINGVADVVIEDELSHWSQSDFAGAHAGKKGAMTCVDCHMPKVPSRDPAAKNGLIRSHRFFGGNTALPTLNRDHEQLQATVNFLRDGKIKLECVSYRRSGSLQHGCAPLRAAAGDDIELNFDVVNHAVGHTFPAGTVDSNESWAELQVHDRSGRSVFHRGFLTPGGEVDTEANFFRSVFVDRHGQLTDRRNSTTDATRMIASTVIPPGGRSTVQYRFTIPRTARFPLSARAKVNWRKFAPSFTQWVFAGTDPPQLPITILDEITLPIVADGSRDNRVSARPGLLHQSMSTRRNENVPDR